MSRFRLLAVVLAAAGFGGCFFVNGRAAIIGSGTIATETRPLEPFSAVEARGSFDTKITVGGEPGVEVEADDNILPLIATEVRDGTLVIDASSSYSARRSVMLRVTAPRLEEVRLAGSGDVLIDNVDSDRFRIELRGSGDVTVSGRAGSLEISLMGSGDIDARDLRVEKARVSLLGSGDVDLFASEELIADIRGSGDVSCAGHPGRVEKSVFGTGDIDVID